MVGAERKTRSSKSSSLSPRRADHDTGNTLSYSGLPPSLDVTYPSRRREVGVLPFSSSSSPAASPREEEEEGSEKKKNMLLLGFLVPPSFRLCIERRAAQQSLLQEVINACLLESSTTTFENDDNEEEEEDSRSNSSVHRIRQNLYRKRSLWQKVALRSREEAHNHERTLQSLKEAARRATATVIITSSDQADQEQSAAISSPPTASALLEQAARERKQQQHDNAAATRIQALARGYIITQRREQQTTSAHPVTQPTVGIRRSGPRLPTTTRPARPHQRQVSDVTMSEFGNSTHQYCSSHHSTCLSIREVEHEDGEEDESYLDDDDDDDDDEFAHDEETDTSITPVPGGTSTNNMETVSQGGLTSCYTGTSFETYSEKDDDAGSFGSASLADPFLFDDDDDDEDSLQGDEGRPALVRAPMHRSAESLDFFKNIKQRSPPSSSSSFRNKKVGNGDPVSCFHLSYGSYSSRWDCSGHLVHDDFEEEDITTPKKKADVSSSVLPVQPPFRRLSPRVVGHFNKIDNNININITTNINEESSSSIQSSMSLPPRVPLRKSSMHGIGDGGAVEPAQGRLSLMLSDCAPSRNAVEKSKINPSSSVCNSSNHNDSMSSIFSTKSMESSPMMPLRKASTHGNHPRVAAGSTTSAAVNRSTNSGTTTGYLSLFAPGPPAVVVEASPRLPRRKASVQQQHHEQAEEVRRRERKCDKNSTPPPRTNKDHELLVVFRSPRSAMEDHQHHLAPAVVGQKKSYYY